MALPILWAPVTPAIQLVDNSGVGEGIAGWYPFLEGKNYLVNVKVLACSNHVAFHVAIGQGVPPNSSFCAATCGIPGNFNSPLPSFSSPPITITATSPISPGTDILVPIYILPGGGNYDWIAIYAHDPDECSSTLIIDHVEIKKKCEDELILSGATIPTFYYGGYHHIYAGSSYGSGTVPSNIGNGIFEATTEIVMSPGFVANPTGSDPFIARIVHSSCAYATRPEDATNINISYGDPMGETLAQAVYKEIAVYPNPSSDHKITVVNLYGSATMVELYDVTGKCLSKSSLQRHGNETLDYSTFSSGIYYLRLTGPGINETKKIVFD